MMGDAPRPGTADDRISLTVVHGHLAFSSYPVLVGHYDADTFAGTEARLDRALKGRLSHRRKMGLYPGKIGTSAILLDPRSKPCGAVVVGLGEPASLSIGALRETLRRGILAYATETTERPGADSEGHAPLGLSALLVGTGEGGVGRTTSVQALLQATTQANAILASLSGACPRIGALEIIELFEDRAFETWRVAKKTVDGDPALKSGFALVNDVKGRSGGWRQAPIAPDPNWWLPIQITMPQSGEKGRSLTFTVGGGFARAEAQAIAANLDKVAPLLRRTARNIDLDNSATSPGRILFELLWPESIKERSDEERNRRLIVDEWSAAFPWELMDDRRPWLEGSSDLTRQPPAVRSGLIRQLLQNHASEKAVPPHGSHKALVIGDPGAEPPPGFARLQGAQEEARAVKKSLEAARNPINDVTLLLTAAATPEQIIKQLFGYAWEIVHICAHGVVDYQFAGGDAVKRTGIVLAPGMVLGPSDLSQIPVSPSIAFINCCNLGEIDAASEDKARQEGLDGRPELAASVAVQLIRLGVRCVVVAGWEISDLGGKTFATTFYDAMLAGATFGEATLWARQATYRAQPDNNTWGAYQCYGDPDYRLRPAVAAPPADDAADQFVGVSEAIDAARQIAVDVNVGLERDLPNQRERLRRIEREAKRKGWLGRDLLCEALAEARAELGDLPEAIAFYSTAATSLTARIRLSAVEQLANLEIRDAVNVLRRSPPDGRRPAEATARIEGSQKRLASLIEAVGPTPERLTLQAGGWKRLAQIDPSGASAEQALRRMKESCDAAFLLGGEDPDYARFGACVAETCIAARDGTATDPSVGPDLQRMIDQASAEGADFWKLIRSADARTQLAILGGETPKDLNAIKDGYLQAWRHVGSPIKMRSVVEQLEFWEDILAGGAPDTAGARSSTVAWIADLRAFVDRLSQT